MKLLIVIAAAIVGLAIGCGRGTPPETREPTAMTDYPDDAVLAQLVAAGADLSTQYEPEFFLYFPDQQTAERIGVVLRGDGFRVEVRPAASGDQWLCLATMKMVLERERLAAIRRRFTSLAEANGGEYDGWETPVAPAGD